MKAPIALALVAALAAGCRPHAISFSATDRNSLIAAITAYAADKGRLPASRQDVAPYLTDSPYSRVQLRDREWTLRPEVPDDGVAPDPLVIRKSFMVEGPGWSKRVVIDWATPEATRGHAESGNAQRETGAPQNGK